MKIKFSITSLMTMVILCGLLSCQDEAIDAAAVNKVPVSKTQIYIYEGQAFYEDYTADGQVVPGRDSKKVDAIFSKEDIALFSSTYNPEKIFIFNSAEERDKFADQMRGSKSSEQGRTSATQADFPRYVTFYNGIGVFPEPITQLFNIFQFGNYNSNAKRYELTDLRNFNYAGMIWNDAISSMRGGQGSSCSAFTVVIWEDPNFRGNSWSIDVASSPTLISSFAVYNLHERRMTSRKNWGDNISSIYVKSDFCF